MKIETYYLLGRIYFKANLIMFYFPGLSMEKLLAKLRLFSAVASPSLCYPYGTIIFNIR